MAAAKLLPPGAAQASSTRIPGCAPETSAFESAETVAGDLFDTAVQGQRFSFRLDSGALEELAEDITNTALCGLGQSACKPVQSTLRYFRDEYLAHVVDHHCPICNGRKRHLEIIPELCKGCGKCARNCPMDAISGQIRMPHVIDTTKCIHCGACWGACPFGAIDAIEEEV